jgi:hypothetical protein
VPATVTYDAAIRMVTLHPNGELAPSTTYTASLSGARDLAGNLMAPLAWSFTTAAVATPDTTAPTVTLFNPSNGALAVATSAAPVVTFSEAMDASSITASTVFLRNASGPPITRRPSHHRWHCPTR